MSEDEEIDALAQAIFIARSPTLGDSYLGAKMSAQWSFRLAETFIEVRAAERYKRIAGSHSPARKTEPPADRRMRLR